MAEILGPLGTTTSLLSLIFATIPTIMKARQNYLECIDQLRRYKLRVSSCEAKIETLLMRRKGFQISGNRDDQVIIDDIEKVHRNMDLELRKYAITNAELDMWQKRKVIPCRILGQLGTRPNKYFHSTVYALYQRNIIDDWVNGMEKLVDCLERLLAADIEKQTAGHFKDLDLDKVTEVEDLKRFVGNLNKLATALYKGTVTSPATASVHDWALGLRSPEKCNDVEHWKFSDITIEVFFSGSRSLKERKFRMQINYQRYDLADQLNREKIEQIILSQVGKGSDFTHRSVQCSVQDPEIRKTRPLGTLFKEKPNFFQDLTWKSDRVGLIHGLLNWALLLWDTNWMKHLCSRGLQVVKEVPLKGCMQTFAIRSCLEGNSCNHSSRLRNLGLILAEIILATPIRPNYSMADDYDPLPCEQFKNGHWESLSSMKIAQEVCNKTKSICFANAVRFCLTDVSKLATEPFQSGYTFRCIEKIYKP